jgi:tetratricopeptide (TPR) repeat protein
MMEKPLYRSVTWMAAALSILGAAAPPAGADDHQACRGLNRDEALAACSRLIARSPKDADAYNNRGLAHSARGEYDRGIADFDRAIQLDPRLAAAYNNRANAYRSKGDYDRAIADYSRAMRLDPKNAVAYDGRGNALNRKGQYDRAISDFDQAMHLDPKDAVAYDGRGFVYSGKGEYERAIADFDQAIRLDSQLADAYYGRARAYSGRGEYDRAIVDYDEAIRLDPKDSVSYDGRGGVYSSKGEYDRAIADFDRAIALDPNFADAFSDRGLAYAGTGNFDRATDDLNKAIALDQRHERGYANLAAVDEMRGDPVGAIANADEAIRLDPRDAVAFNVRGKAWFDNDQYALALADFDQAIRLDPALADARRNRARAQAALAPSSPQQLPAPPSGPSAPRAVVTNRRVALVIGNSHYRSVPSLSTPQRDAEAVAEALRGDGFQTVMLMSDLGRDAMRSALRTFRAVADAADWAVIYYAGHGIELGSTGHLVPVDATLDDEHDASAETVSYDEITQSAGTAGELRLVIIDASRADPFAAAKDPSSAGTSGLGTPREAKSGTVVVYSTKDGGVAEQGGGATSPFATALAARFKIRGRELRRVFDDVRTDVLAATGGRQEPVVDGSLPGQKSFYFVPGQ